MNLEYRDAIFEIQDDPYPDHVRLIAVIGGNGPTSALRHAGRSTQCREPVGGQSEIGTGSRLLPGVAWRGLSLLTANRHDTRSVFG